MLFDKICKFPGTKMLLLSVSSAALVACGGSGGSTPTPTTPVTPTPTSTTPTPTPTGSIGASDPFDQSTCESYTEYVWDEGRCVLAENRSVINVAQIESLPANDKEDLLRWLARVDKNLALDSVFPRWSDESETEIPRDVHVDIGLLAQKLDNKPYFSISDNEHVLLDRIDTSYVSGFENKSESTTVNGNVVVAKSAGLDKAGSTAVLSVNDLPVYTVSLAENLVLGTHLGKTGSYDSDLTVVSTTYVSTNESENAIIDFSYFERSLRNHVSPSDQSKTDAASLLSIDDANVDDLIELSSAGSHDMSAAHIEVEDYSAYINQNVPKIYGEKGQLFEDFVDGENISNIHVDVFYKASDLTRYGFSRPVLKQGVGYSYVLDSSSTDWSENGSIIVESAAVAFQMLDLDAQFDIDLAGRFIDRHRLISTSPEGIGSIYHPSYEQIFDPFSGIYSNIEIKQAIFESNPALMLFVEKTVPDYGVDGRLDGVQRTNGWRNQNEEMYFYLVEDETDTEARLNTYAATAVNVSPAANDFVTQVNSDVLDLLSPLTDEERGMYQSMLISTGLKFGYYFVDLDNKEDILNAISAAGVRFSGGVMDLLRRNQTINITRLNAVTRDSAAVQRLSEVDDILAVEYKSAVELHDQIAGQYDLPLRAGDFVNAPIEGLGVQAVNNKITTLNVIDQFKRSDEATIDSSSDFNSGKEAVASIAYQEDWTNQTFSDLETILSYLQPFATISSTKVLQCEDKTTTFETYDCVSTFSSMERRVTTDKEIGYLGKYDGIANPFVANASTFLAITGKFSLVTDFNTTAGINLKFDYEAMIENGDLLSCAPDEIGQRVTDLSQTLDDLLSIYEAHSGIPNIGSDDYEETRRLIDQFSGLAEGC